MDQVVCDTLIRACELALLAVGLTLTFGAVKFPNVANTEFATLGAYGVLLVGNVSGLGLVGSSAVSVVLMAVTAALLYRVVLRRLIAKSPALALIGSFALSIVLRAGLQAIAGPDAHQYELPLERGVHIGSALVTPVEIRLVAISVTALAVVLLMLRLTPLGRSIRAVSTNPQLAAAAGINAGLVVYVVWAIAGALGALDGIFLGLDTAASIGMGFDLLLPVFAVAVLGGLASPGGAVIAALIVAALESALVKIDFGRLLGGASHLIPVDYRAAVAFVLLVVMLLLRPQGLLGREVRRA